MKIISIITEILGDLLRALFSNSPQKKGFDAKFGKETSIGNRFNKGFVYSVNRKLTRKQSYENVLLVGPTGSGKTTKILIKELFEIKNCSIVLNDPSKELYLATAGYLKDHFDIKVINFSDSSVSHGYNILSRITNNSDIQKVVHQIVSASLDSGGKADPFWNLQAMNLLAIFVRLVRHQDKKYQNMANVLYLLKLFSASPKEVDTLIIKTCDKELFLDYKSVVAIPEKTLQSIVASAKAAMQIFEDSEIAKVTAEDTISFKELRLKPTIIFLHNSIESMKYVNVLNGIFFEQLYGQILKALPKKEELDLFVILEECSSMYIGILPLALANTRKHRTGNIVCIQQSEQLKNYYQNNVAGILGNCITKIYLPGQTSLETLRELEAYSGQIIHEDKNKVKRVKPLMSIEQLRTLPNNRSIILCGNKPMILGKTKPVYKMAKYKKLLKLAPPVIQGAIPKETVPLINTKQETTPNTTHEKQ